MTGRSPRNFCQRTRREFLWQAGAGFTGLALTGLLDQDGAFGETDPGQELSGRADSPQKTHFPAKAKSVIFLFMYGGPSQVDTFDYKPKLYELDGQVVPVKTFGRVGRRNEGRVVGPRWKFAQHGQCGQWVSDLFPQLATCVDDIAFLHSMTADSPVHGSAMMQMNTGNILSGSPCLGSWVNYGLGSENRNLPGFVVMLDPTGGPINGAKNWSSGYMPASYQATMMRSAGEPILDLQRPEGISEPAQRRFLDALETYNREHAGRGPDNSDLAARIASYELAFNMQRHCPETVDLSDEPAEVRKLYGLDTPLTEDFGRRCLLARRLVERGVRFVQLYAGGAHADHNWDAHSNMESNHNHHAGRTDRPIAGLLKDLKRRGLLDQTLVVWGGEFGRQPTAENVKGTGRDHSTNGFTMWMAGGGIKGGISVGATDELGAAAVEDRYHVKNLHATVLHQLGIDPNKLTYFHGGLDQKLVGVEGAEPIAQII